MLAAATAAAEPTPGTPPEGERAEIICRALGAITAGVLAATRPEKVDRPVLIGGGLQIAAGPGSWPWDIIRLLAPPPIDTAGQFMADWYWSPTPVDAVFLQHEMAEALAMPAHVWQACSKGSPCLTGRSSPLLSRLRP